MKKFILLLLAITLVFTVFCGCKDKQTAQEEGVTVTFNNEQGEMPKQTEPAEPLNKALEREEISFEGGCYGVIINNASAEDAKAVDVETFDNGGSDTIIVMPYYEGSKVLVESVMFDMETSEIIHTGTLFESTSTEDYALVVKVDRPGGVIPEMRVTVEYDGQIYSNLIKNEPDSKIEYIR